MYTPCPGPIYTQFPFTQSQSNDVAVGAGAVGLGVTGAGVAVGLLRHDEDGLHLGLEVAVHEGHVELELEVGEHA